MTETATPITFDIFLVKTVEKQLASIDGNQEKSLISEESRKSLLDTLLKVKQKPDDDEPLFDQISLEQVDRLLDAAQSFRDRLSYENHPAQLLYSNPASWFEQSYPFLYEEVSYLELMRFFAAGKTPSEKEGMLRSMASKLMKTQETIRTIKKNPEFIERYLEYYSAFREKGPESLKENLELPKVPSPNQTIFIGLQTLLEGIAREYINLFQKLEITLPEPAEAELTQKRCYNALVLSIRHSAGLLEEVPQEQYDPLVQQLGTVITASYAHPEIYLFHHIKREYLVDWLVHVLRQKDAENGDTLFQEAKIRSYNIFDFIELDPEILDQMTDLESFQNPAVLEKEMEALRGLSEEQFFEVILKIYGDYKGSDLADDLPLPPDVMAAAGDTGWEEKRMVAQATQQEKENPGKSPMSGMLNALKKTFTIFRKADEKIKEKEEKVAQAPPEEKEETPPETSGIQHTGKRLKPCFPLPDKEVAAPTKGQKQDPSFSNSDTDAALFPIEQEFIVNMFNVNNDSNNPLNQGYNKFSSTVSTILKSYDSEIQQIQKKISSGGNVSSFTEKVLYVLVDDHTILAVGITNMGQSSNLGAFPKGETNYFRLFVKGDLQKGLPKIETPNLIKEFKLPQKNFMFMEVLHEHCHKDPSYAKLLVTAISKLIAGLSEEDFAMIDDEDLIGFTKILSLKEANLAAA